MELRHTLLLRAGDSASRWSLAALATATMLTSAMALYYYVPWSQLELNMEQLLSSSFGEEGFGSVAEYTSESIDEDDDEDDDDEHVDPDLLDGFSSREDQSMSVVLTSSDPTSDLCHRPIMMDLSGQTPSKPISGVSTPARNSSVDVESQQINDASLDTIQLVKEERAGPLCQSMPSILKRDGQPLRSSRHGSPLPLNRKLLHPSKQSSWHDSRSESSSFTSDLLQLPSETDISSSSTFDNPTTSNMEKCSSQCSAESGRSVVLREPDWTPFTGTHDRARKRVMVASLANTMSELHSANASPSEKHKHLPILDVLPFEPPQELGDGSEFWFERFTRSTAAAGKHWDWRRRSTTDLVELLNDSLLESLENVEKERVEGQKDPLPALNASENCPLMSKTQSEPSPDRSKAAEKPVPKLSMPSFPFDSSVAPSEEGMHRSESSSSTTDLCFTPTKRKFELDLDKLEIATAPDALELNRSSSSRTSALSPLPSAQYYSQQARRGFVKLTAPFSAGPSLAKRRLKNKFGGQLDLALVGT